MARLTRQVVACPLKPGKFDVPWPLPCEQRPFAGKFLIWRDDEGAGWVLAFGRPVETVMLSGHEPNPLSIKAIAWTDWSFDVIAQDLPCWHAAVAMSRKARWDKGDPRPGAPFHGKPGWITEGYPVAVWRDGPRNRTACDICWREITGRAR